MAFKILYDSGTLKNDTFNNGTTFYASSRTSDLGDAWRRAFKTHTENFSVATMRNNGSDDIKIRLDGLTTREYVLPANTTMVIERDEDLHFSDVLFVNDSGNNISANVIIFNFQIVKTE